MSQDGLVDETQQYPSALFSYGYSLDGNHATVLASGELDMSTAPILRDCIDAVVGQGATNIDVDLHGITFLDSQGIALLVHAHRDLESSGGALRVLHPQAQVLKVMHVSAVDQYLTIVSEFVDQQGTAPAAATTPSAPMAPPAAVAPESSLSS